MNVQNNEIKQIRDYFLWINKRVNNEMIYLYRYLILFQLVVFQPRNGLDTVIEEVGNNFSAGEKQLINISRTLLNPKKIVLIDQANASIDYKSDELLQKVIKERLKNSTIFTIAHRIDTILESDRIIALDKGKLVEVGSPKDFLQRNSSLFANLYKQSRNRQSK